MSTIGPTLPPHLQTKRKRPEHQATDEIHVVRSTSPVSDCGEKRRRVVGPSLPPATLDERPSHLPAEVDRDLAPEQIADDSDSDDGFGPALPSAAGTANAIAEAHRQKAVEEDIRRLEAQRKPQREEWMLVPPKQDDWSARVDPTKLKNRKFNTGKGAKAPTHNGGDNALWTETPEDKRRRLEDEVMGVKAPGQSDVDNKKTAKSAAEIQKIERRIREYNEKNRDSSLYSEHKKAVPKEKEDDPSARAFDKEKDIGGGVKIGHAKRKEMLNHAADFGSKFAGGNYL